MSTLFEIIKAFTKQPITVLGLKTKKWTQSLFDLNSIKILFRF